MPRATIKFTTDRNAQDNCWRTMRRYLVWLTSNRRGILLSSWKLLPCVRPIHAGGISSPFRADAFQRDRLAPGDKDAIQGQLMPALQACSHQVLKDMPPACTRLQRSICSPWTSRYDYPRVARPAPIYRLASGVGPVQLELLQLDSTPGRW